MLAFAATLQASWESLGSSLISGLLNGGPVAIIYGLILAFIGSLGLTLSLAELASMYVPLPQERPLMSTNHRSLPVAGAQYHWTYELAPVAPRFLSFLQGELYSNLDRRYVD